MELFPVEKVLYSATVLTTSSFQTLCFLKLLQIQELVLWLLYENVSISPFNPRVHHHSAQRQHGLAPNLMKGLG